jgi:hypothetical protein
MCSHYKSVRDKAILHQAFGLNQLDDLGKPDLWPSYEGLFIRPHPHADVGDDAVPPREAVVVTCPGIFRPSEIRDNGSLTVRSSDEESTIYGRTDRSHIARS